MRIEALEGWRGAVVSLVLTDPLKFVLLIGGIDNVEFPASQKQEAGLDKEEIFSSLDEGDMLSSWM